MVNNDDLKGEGSGTTDHLTRLVPCFSSFAGTIMMIILIHNQNVKGCFINWPILLGP
jgi:hypothetical protein